MLQCCYRLSNLNGITQRADSKSQGLQVVKLSIVVWVLFSQIVLLPLSVSHRQLSLSTQTLDKITHHQSSNLPPHKCNPRCVYLRFNTYEATEPIGWHTSSTESERGNEISCQRTSTQALGICPERVALHAALLIARSDLSMALMANAHVRQRHWPLRLSACAVYGSVIQSVHDAQSILPCF